VWDVKPYYPTNLVIHESFGGLPVITFTTSSQLQRITTPFDQYHHITLLSNRGTCVWTTCPKSYKSRTAGELFRRSLFFSAWCHLAEANLDALWHALVSVMHDRSLADRVRRRYTRWQDAGKKSYRWWSKTGHPCVCLSRQAGVAGTSADSSVSALSHLATTDIISRRRGQASDSIPECRRQRRIHRGSTGPAEHHLRPMALQIWPPLISLTGTCRHPWRGAYRWLHEMIPHE